MAARGSDVAVPTSPVEQVAHRLLARYDEPVRHYHSRVHLAEMYGAFEDLADALALTRDQRLAARLAIWFHDAVYDPTARSGANERESARLAGDTLASLGASARLTRTVAALVLATADHRAGGTDPVTTAAFLDADLWILAAPAPRFDEYCTQVRLEYAVVDAATYATARASILADLVDRPGIYETPAAHDAWSDLARANVAREVARLRA